jgi:hypothetical protein
VIEALKTIKARQRCRAFLFFTQKIAAGPIMAVTNAWFAHCQKGVPSKACFKNSSNNL